MTKFRYKHIQSTVENKVPLDLLDGEIAVNRFAGKEKLFLKNASGNIVSFSTDSAIDGKLADKLNVSDFNTYSGAVNTTINSKAAQSDLNTLSGTVTAHTADTNIHVTTADKTAWNNKVDDSDLVDFFDDAKYEMSGQTHVINFYNGNTVKATIDCTDFLMDGMIDDVRIETISGVTYLVIDFNTASGKEDIKIPLTDIFNPDNYYTKDELTGSSTTVVVAKASSASTAASAGSVALSNVTGADDLKAIEALAGTSGILKKTAANIWSLDTTSYSSATEVNTALGDKLDVSAFNTYSGTVDTLISSKASQSDLTALSGTVTGHTSNTDIHLTSTQKENIDSLEANIDTISGITAEKVTNWDAAATYRHSHSNKTALDSITGNVGTMAYQATGSYSSATQVNTALGNKLNVSDFNTYSGAVDTEIGSKASQSDLNTLSGTVTGHTGNTDIHLTSTEKANIDSLSGAVGSMAYESTTDYYKKSDTSGKTEISTALGGKVNSATYTAHTADTSAHFSGNEKKNLDSLATNIAAISGITSTKVGNWDTAATNSHTHGNKTELDSITGSVGTMAYQNTSSYSSATQVNTALSGKSNTGHTHDDRYYTESELTGSSTTVVVAKAASATTAASAGSVAWGNVSGKPETFTPSAHNQASNTITAMTSYSIASASGAVATNDTLNTAVGKLEKRITILEAALGGMTLVKLTSAQYEALTTKDPNTMYIIND